MSSNILGRKVAKIALTYNGAKTGSAKHKALVKEFNKEKPNGEVAQTSYAWCAIAWTAWMLKAGLKHADVPMSCNVGNLIKQAKKRGIWKEADDYKPRVGDGIVYDWTDDGKGENKSGASHIGLVYASKHDKIYVIEGNKGEAGVCGKRTISVDGRYIRGFITPKYNAILIDKTARSLSWKKGTEKTKWKKPRKTFRVAWKEKFPKRKMGNGCHQFVMLVMRMCGYKVMPLAWDKIIDYLKERCTYIKPNHKASQLRKGDIMVYRRKDSKGTHYHIWVIVEVGGDLMIAEANQGRYYAHINKSLKKALKTYDKSWIFRPKEK